MSSTTAEQAIVSAKANVMIYDDPTKKWNPAGTNPGLSKVYVYQNLLNQTYRVVGRKIQDHECVINCMLSKTLKYQANQTFLQWRDVKQVYGLHFQSKDETELFVQVLKTAVDNLARVAAASQANTNGGDNVSLGKRSINSEYNNPLIYDENDRQNYNLNSHHPNSIYNGMNTQRSQPVQQVTSPPLSNSSSSSSSTISSNGLSINTQNGIHPQINGHQQINNYQNNNNQRTNQNDYNYSNQQQNGPIYNMQHQQINTSSTSSSSSSSNGNSNTQQPLYQSSPIPPPPPPPSVPIFSNQNGISNNFTQVNDNLSQKIYDVIPDNSNYTSNHQAGPNSVPPPPPPIPTGLFSSVPANGGAPPPPPPMGSLQTLSINGNSNGNRSPPSNVANHAEELSRSIANRQLKKVEESGNSNNINNNHNNNNRLAAPPQLDFLTEIRQKLEAKNLGASGSSNENENLKPSNGLKKISRNTLSNDSPKPIKKITSTPNVIDQRMNGSSTQSSSNLTNGNTNGHYMDTQSYDKLKQELLSEFRKELQMIKSDIVSSILQELRR